MRTSFGAPAVGTQSYSEATLIATGAFTQWRDGAGLIQTGPNQIAMLGGWSNPGSPWPNTTTNQILISNDWGRSFTEALAHVDDPPQTGSGARWKPRHYAGWIGPYNFGGIDYVMVIGADPQSAYATGHLNDEGYNTGIKHDVWRAPCSDLTTWTRMTAAAEFGAIHGHICWQYAGALYVAGGQTDAILGGLNSHVWRSTDCGATWAQLADASWPARGFVTNPVDWRGLTWLWGGGTYHNTVGLRTYYNDLWTFDGTIWTQVAQSNAPTAREYHSLKLWDDRLWVLNGYNGANNASAAWTQNGTWTTVAVTWPAGHADGFVGTSRGIINSSGNGSTTGTYLMQSVTA
jgi:hypothetical protein